MIFNGTEAQARKNIIENLEANMFVEAGAGAGKTTLVVERITHMLKNGYKPSQIVAITFTNAAAEELRGRIVKRVSREGLKEALSHLDEMNISTIHSFCNVLLKEQAVAAGLPVDLTLIDEREENRLKYKYLNDYLKNLDETEWNRLETMSGETQTRGYVKSLIEKMYVRILDQPENVTVHVEDGKDIKAMRADLASMTKAQYDAAINQRVDAVSDKILELANSLILKSELKHKDFTSLLSEPKLTSKSFRDNMPNLFGPVTDYAGADAWFYENMSKLTTKSALFNKTNRVAYDDNKVKDANAKLKDFVMSQYRWRMANDFLPYYDWNMAMTDHAIKASEHYRKSMPVNTVTNDKLLVLTNKMICNDEDDRAYRYFASKYKTFFVDEFQDTDSIQAGFIYRLASDPEDPMHEKLRNGALFVVGDPKQSIYRFRGAQPEVYFGIKKKMGGLDNATVFELKENYRTNEDLIGWINDKFSEADGLNGNNTPENTMYIVDKAHPYIPMTAVKKVASDKDKLIYGAYRVGNADSYVETSADKPDPASYEVEDDIEDVVKLIKNLVEGGYKITDYDRTNSQPFARNIKYSDILLITPLKKGDMENYLKALKKSGISVKFDGESSLKDDFLLNVYVRIYKHLINPMDRFFRVGAMEAIRRTKITTDEEELDRFTDYILDSLRKGSEKMTPFGVARYLEKQLSALVMKDTEISYIDLNSSMTKIRQMIEFLCKNECGNGMSLIRAMDRYVEDGIQHELSPERNADSSIRLMNLHKTKGLEGKIVIVANRINKHWDTSMEDYRCGNDYYPGRKGFCVANFIDSTLNDRFIAEEKAEFHRLEYVAVTRAEQAVIFMNTISSGGIFANRKYTKSKGLEDGFDYKLRNIRSLRDVIESGAAGPRVIKVNGPYDVAQDHYTHPEINNDDARSKKAYTKLSPSELETKDSERVIKKKFIKEAEAAGMTGESQKSPSLARPADNHVGNVLHRTMELLVKRASAANTGDGTDTAKCAVEQALYEYRDEITGRKEYTAAQVRDFIMQCALSYHKWIRSDPEGLFAGVKKVYTELPFSYYDKDTGVFMKGNADLIMEKEDGSAVLIDYKSDKDDMIPEEGMADVLAEKYTPQIKAYKETIRRLMRIPEDSISSFIISFSQKDEKGTFYGDETVRVRCTPIMTNLS